MRFATDEPDTPDPHLLARRLSQMPFASVDGSAWRHVAPARNAISGLGARAVGGRFNPPDSFPVLYLAMGRDVAAAELVRLATGQNMSPADLLPRFVYRLRLQSNAVLDLRDEKTRRFLGLSIRDIAGETRHHAQLLGELANQLGFELVLSPSATGVGDIAAVFPYPGIEERLAPALVETWFLPEQLPGWNRTAGAEGVA